MIPTLVRRVEYSSININANRDSPDHSKISTGQEAVTEIRACPSCAVKAMPPKVVGERPKQVVHRYKGPKKRGDRRGRFGRKDRSDD